MSTKTDRSLSPFNNELRLKGFKVFKLEQDSDTDLSYSRKDFYKICLTTGKSRIHYSDQSFEQDGSILFFGNPHIPYSWEALTEKYTGYTCLFSEEFLQLGERLSPLLKSPLFQLGGTPVLDIKAEQKQFLDYTFSKMLEEQEGDYDHKADLIRNYIQLLLHEALKMEPSPKKVHDHKASTRLSTVFFELLERQFPIESPQSPLKLKSAQQYAEQLAVHPNYLNRALKETTGKSTSSLISERVITEAKALLQFTNWNISEIAYSLGFDYPTYFNNFYKKHTGETPSDFRQVKV